MRREHAITYKGCLSLVQLEYLIHKATRLSSIGHNILGVTKEEDGSDIHLYFEVMEKCGCSSKENPNV